MAVKVTAVKILTRPIVTASGGSRICAFLDARCEDLMVEGLQLVFHPGEARWNLWLPTPPCTRSEERRSGRAVYWPAKSPLRARFLDACLDAYKTMGGVEPTPGAAEVSEVEGD